MHRCDCGCPTYGAHLRNKNFRVAYARSAAGQDASTQKKWDRELEAYRDARAQGIQPAGTSMAKVRAALDQSDAQGSPFDAGVGGGI